eukprot:CAMPEP_0202860332 /NCGR_PEP_ID=MMETSP1391-20130828/2084_1 /ASSEMBLY_ACC=CAM_ASM_000867 /TAXON_ID=1034604 /ORGANISM="Chlamydomonas leiostraca, Strain SAG 11-49" /LENGTH=262 /DNA_ID=CAMNT_0049539487 /DNA_START=417 /DNA_END=1203 /DNA_ORIENTATION=-
MPTLAAAFPAAAAAAATRAPARAPPSAASPAPPSPRVPSAFAPDAPGQSRSAPAQQQRSGRAEGPAWHMLEGHPSETGAPPPAWYHHPATPRVSLALAPVRGCRAAALRLTPPSAPTLEGPASPAAVTELCARDTVTRAGGRALAFLGRPAAVLLDVGTCAFVLAGAGAAPPWMLVVLMGDLAGCVVFFGTWDGIVRPFTAATDGASGLLCGPLQPRAVANAYFHAHLSGRDGNGCDPANGVHHPAHGGLYTFPQLAGDEHD